MCCCHVCHFLPLHLYLKKKSDTHLQRCVSLEMLIYVHWWQLLLFSFFFFIGSPIPLPPETQNLRNIFLSFSAFSSLNSEISLKSSKGLYASTPFKKTGKNIVLCLKNKKERKVINQQKPLTTWICVGQLPSFANQIKVIYSSLVDKGNLGRSDIKEVDLTNEWRLATCSERAVNMPSVIKPSG